MRGTRPLDGRPHVALAHHNRHYNPSVLWTRDWFRTVYGTVRRALAVVLIAQLHGQLMLRRKLLSVNAVGDVVYPTLGVRSRLLVFAAPRCQHVSVAPHFVSRIVPPPSTPHQVAPHYHETGSIISAVAPHECAISSIVKSRQHSPFWRPAYRIAIDHRI